MSPIYNLLLQADLLAAIAHFHFKCYMQELSMFLTNTKPISYQHRRGEDLPHSDTWTDVLESIESPTRAKRTYDSFWDVANISIK